MVKEIEGQVINLLEVVSISFLNSFINISIVKNKISFNVIAYLNFRIFIFFWINVCKFFLEPLYVLNRLTF